MQMLEGVLVCMLTYAARMLTYAARMLTYADVCRGVHADAGGSVGVLSEHALKGMKVRELCQHTSAFVSIRQHTLACFSIRV
jgi:hypothetical protein